jgi:formylglycine-generating enzyme required for sulfatase activity
MKRLLYILAIVAIITAVGWTVHSKQQSSVANNAVANVHQCLENLGEQVWIEGGTFTMGSEDFYREEGPTHQVTVDGFWIDTHEVTNAQFAKFVNETGYVTVAERVPNLEEIPGAPPEMLKPGSAIFTPPNTGGKITSWWSYMPGASWKHPRGPESNIEGKELYPVVQIAFEDAQAYARWAGRELPTEAQYEFAARSKQENQVYAWDGDKVALQGKHMANTWQGFFPVNNSKEDGYEGIAPVGCYDANQYGAYDLIGNVWEWTANWYAPKHNPNDTDNPKGPKKEQSYDKNNPGFPVRVIKGGSFLCAPNFCARYRPAARHAQDTGLGADHIGFRTVLLKN